MKAEPRSQNPALRIPLNPGCLINDGIVILVYENNPHLNV